MSDAWTRVSSEEDTLPDDLLVYLLCITYMELLIFIRYLPITQLVHTITII